MSNCDDVNWGCVTVDTTGWADTSSVAFDPSGNPWVSYYLGTTDQYRVARYLGGATTGTGCAINTWTCMNVVTAANGWLDSMAFDSAGNPWMAYYTGTTNTSLGVARYLGGATNGTGCNINTWTCTEIETTNDVGNYPSIAFDITGNPWVSYYNTTSGDLEIARYLGGATTGTGCAINTWTCAAIHTTNDVGAFSSIAFDPSGNAWVSYYEGPTTSCDNSPTTECSLWIAKYQGGATSGTGCALNTWTCTNVDNPTGTGNTGRNISMAIDASGNPWISYISPVGTVGLYAAHYLGGATSGTGCTGTTTWTCTYIDNRESLDRTTGIALDSSGNPWISAYDTISSDLRVNSYLGGATSGSGCSAVSTWKCVTVDSGGSPGNANSIAFDSMGTPWVSYRDNSNGYFQVAKMHSPPGKLNTGLLSVSPHRNTPRGERSRLNSGYSPRSTSTCAGTTDLLGYCGVATDDSSYDSVTATNARPIFTAALKNSSPSSVPTITWIGRSNIAPSTATTTGDLVLQVYNITTNAWENVATDSASSDCNTVDCTLTGLVPNVAQQSYYEGVDSDFWLYIRVWQYENTSSQTLKTDFIGTTFENTGSMLRTGNRFLNGAESGFDL